MPNSFQFLENIGIDEVPVKAVRECLPAVVIIGIHEIAQPGLASGWPFPC